MLHIKEIKIKHYRTKFQLLVLIFIVVLVGWTIKTSIQNNKDKKNQEVLLDKQEYILEDVLVKVSRHVEVPNDVPLMAIIDNAQALRDYQVFYADAEDGDLLFIFTEKAIIYRPDTDVVINIGPVLFAQP